MSKKRYTLYLSRPLARKFDLIAQQRQGAKSALVEEALRLSLEPQPHPGLDDGLARRLDELNRNVARIGRDVAVATETLALFVRYFLTITPPLPQSEQEPARLLGKERFEVFVAQVGRRLAGDHRLVSEVLESIASDSPDLFATATDDAPLRSQAGTRSASANGKTKPNGQHVRREEEDHG
jgi:predicted transcriptional regulator